MVLSKQVPCQCILHRRPAMDLVIKRTSIDRIGKLCKRRLNYIMMFPQEEATAHERLPCFLPAPEFPRNKDNPQGFQGSLPLELHENLLPVQPRLDCIAVQHTAPSTCTIAQRHDSMSMRDVSSSSSGRRSRATPSVNRSRDQRHSCLTRQ